MTPEQQAARWLADCPRFEASAPDGDVMVIPERFALAAIARHLAPGDDLVAQATAALEQLAPYGKQGRGSDHPQSVACRNAADTITALLARLSALTAHVAELEAALSKIDVGEGWAAIIARTALKEAGRK